MHFYGRVFASLWETLSRLLPWEVMNGDGSATDRREGGDSGGKGDRETQGDRPLGVRSPSSQPGAGLSQEGGQELVQRHPAARGAEGAGQGAGEAGLYTSRRVRGQVSTLFPIPGAWSKRGTSQWNVHFGEPAGCGNLTPCPGQPMVWLLPEASLDTGSWGWRGVESGLISELFRK